MSPRRPGSGSWSSGCASNGAGRYGSARPAACGAGRGHHVAAGPQPVACGAPGPRSGSSRPAGRP
eukprot:5518191-Lingulodinium_polyedra.AAC.1